MSNGAWSDLYSRYLIVIRHSARRFGLSDQETQDVAQETFSQLSQGFQISGKKRRIWSLRGLLGWISRCRAHDLFRRKKARIIVSLDEPLAEGEGASLLDMLASPEPEAAKLSLEAKELLDETLRVSNLSKTDPESAQMICMRFAGENWKEISGKLRVRETTLRQRYKRLLPRLKTICESLQKIKGL
jgi:RNA polymerase sigma factor (sigma-70 family)